jgi:hypothetical protein
VESNRGDDFVQDEFVKLASIGDLAGGGMERVDAGGHQAIVREDPLRAAADALERMRVAVGVDGWQPCFAYVGDDKIGADGLAEFLKQQALHRWHGSLFQPEFPILPIGDSPAVRIVGHAAATLPEGAQDLTPGARLAAADAEKLAHRHAPPGAFGAVRSILRSKIGYPMGSGFS